MVDALGDNFIEIFGFFSCFAVVFVAFVRVLPCEEEQPKKKQSARKWRYFAPIPGGGKREERRSRPRHL